MEINLENDLLKLAKCSVMANRLMSCKVELISLETNFREKLSFNQDDFAFHPNGNCGCIRMGDDYIFGIRCDHLMWMEGNCEGTESFWNGNDHLAAESADDTDDVFCTILITANHKGIFMQKLIVFHAMTVENYLVTIKKI